MWSLAKGTREGIEIKEGKKERREGTEGKVWGIRMGEMERRRM